MASKKREAGAGDAAPPKAAPTEPTVSLNTGESSAPASPLTPTAIVVGLEHQARALSVNGDPVFYGYLHEVVVAAAILRQRVQALVDHGGAGDLVRYLHDIL